ncbi:MAG: hypothetical protein AAGF32_08415, partial [Pseudomonadota bacterium]
MTSELTIVELGQSGDGKARASSECGGGGQTGDTGAIFVPYALPGEVVAYDPEAAQGRARIITPSDQRIKPVCPHFLTCPGCQAQHMSSELYEAWKRAQVAEQFRFHGLDADCIANARWVPSSVGARRRVAFSARRGKTEVLIGFLSAQGGKTDGSSQTAQPTLPALAPIQQCPILVPAIERRLPDLKVVLRPLLSRKGQVRVHVTAADNGLDVCVIGVAPETARTSLSAPEFQEALARCGIIRFSVMTADRKGQAPVSGADTSTVFQQVEPVLRYPAVTVPLPVAPFLQASAATEEAIAATVASYANRERTPPRLVADLFCGLGALSPRRLKVQPIASLGLPAHKT